MPLLQYMQKSGKGLKFCKRIVIICNHFVIDFALTVCYNLVKTGGECYEKEDITYIRNNNASDRL